jgi:hypothetical protein
MVRFQSPTKRKTKKRREEEDENEERTRGDAYD